MTDGQPTADQFREDLEALIVRYRAHPCLTYAEAIGVLYLVLHQLTQEDDDERDDY